MCNSKPIQDFATKKQRTENKNRQSNFVSIALTLSIVLVLLAHILYMYNRLNLDKCVAFNFPNNEAVIDCYFNN